MKTNRAILIVLSLFVTVTFSFAQKKDPINLIIKEATVNNQTMNHLDMLSNTFGGRLVGSDAYENAAHWAAYMFEQWGLDVELQEVGSVPVGFNRGPWFGRMLDSEDGMSLNFVTPSYTVGTKGIQRGHVLIEPKTEAEFNRMKTVLKGAWVLVGGRSNGFPIDFSSKGDSLRAEVIKENAEIEKRNTEIRRYNWKKAPKDQKPLEDYIDEPALFYKEMVEAGILGIIQSANVPLVALYDRKNIDSLDFWNLPKVPDIKLDSRQYKVIEEKAKVREYFQLEFDIRNHFKMGPVKYHNVIATIKGSKKPNEYIIHSGHLDAFDSATGGVDCGTGVAPTMETARLVAKAIRETGKRPERTLVFVLFAAEEFGLYGSKHYVKEISKNKDIRIINLFNRDGGPTVASGLSVPEAWYKDMEKICEPLYELREDISFTLSKREPRNKPKVASGTDSGPFMVEGIPSLCFNCSDPLGYNFSYMEIWHTNRDTYDKSIKVYMDHTSLVNAVVMWGMANSKAAFKASDVYID